MKKYKIGDEISIKEKDKLHIRNIVNTSIALNDTLASISEMKLKYKRELWDYIGKAYPELNSFYCTFDSMEMKLLITEKKNK